MLPGAAREEPLPTFEPQIHGPGEQSQVENSCESGAHFKVHFQIPERDPTVGPMNYGMIVPVWFVEVPTFGRNSEIQITMRSYSVTSPMPDTLLRPTRPPFRSRTTALQRSIRVQKLVYFRAPFPGPFSGPEISPRALRVIRDGPKIGPTSGT